VGKFFTVNAENQTGYITIVEAENGEVLYTSDDQPISSFNPIFAHQGMPGFGGGWQGHGKHMNGDVE
jgi:hypothetical protein